MTEYLQSQGIENVTENMLELFQGSIGKAIELKDKQEGASRVFIAIDEKLYAFYNIRLGNKLVKQLFPDKIFLNKDDYHDPLKNIEELLFSL